MWPMLYAGLIPAIYAWYLQQGKPKQPVFGAGTDMTKLREGFIFVTQWVSDALKHMEALEAENKRLIDVEIAGHIARARDSAKLIHELNDTVEHQRKTIEQRDDIITNLGRVMKTDSEEAVRLRTLIEEQKELILKKNEQLAMLGYKEPPGGA